LTSISLLYPLFNQESKDLIKRKKKRQKGKKERKEGKKEKKRKKNA
jgi:hypothetical protein